MLTRFVNQLFYFYYILLLLRVFLTWIPNINWFNQPFKVISQLTDPFLNIFRNVIPPLGGVLDISPILAIIVLQILQGILVGQMFRLGL